MVKLISLLKKEIKIYWTFFLELNAMKVKTIKTKVYQIIKYI